VIGPDTPGATRGHDTPGRPRAPAVKGRRNDASRRRAEGARTRDRVRDVAERMLLDDGFAATSVAAIARAAGVPPELVYKVCGGKAGLGRRPVRRLHLPRHERATARDL